MEDYAQAVAIAKDNPSDTSSVKTESGFKTALIKSTGKFKTFFKTPFPRKFLAIFAVVIVVSGGIWVWAKWKMKNPNSPAASQLGATTTNVPTVPVNRDFEFKVYDKNKIINNNTALIVQLNCLCAAWRIARHIYPHGFWR